MPRFQSQGIDSLSHTSVLFRATKYFWQELCLSVTEKSSYFYVHQCTWLISAVVEDHKWNDDTNYYRDRWYKWFDVTTGEHIWLQIVEVSSRESKPFSNLCFKVIDSILCFIILSRLTEQEEMIRWYRWDVTHCNASFFGLPISAHSVAQRNPSEIGVSTSPHPFFRYGGFRCVWQRYQAPYNYSGTPLIRAHRNSSSPWYVNNTNNRSKYILNH